MGKINNLYLSTESNPANANDVTRFPYSLEPNASMKTDVKSNLGRDGSIIVASEKDSNDSEIEISPRLSIASSSEQNYLLDEVYVPTVTFRLEKTSPSVEIESHVPFMKQTSFIASHNYDIKRQISDSRRSFAAGIFGEAEKTLPPVQVSKHPTSENIFHSKYFYSTPSHTLSYEKSPFNNDPKRTTTFGGLYSTEEVLMCKWVFVRMSISFRGPSLASLSQMFSEFCALCTARLCVC